VQDGISLGFDAPQRIDGQDTAFTDGRLKGLELVVNQVRREKVRSAIRDPAVCFVPIDVDVGELQARRCLA
jgi:hypothetical protein